MTRKIPAASGDSSDMATRAADTAPRGPWRINQVYWFCLGWIALWFVLRAVGVDKNAAPVYVGPFVVILVLAVVNLSLRTWVARLRDHHPAGMPAPLYLGLGWVFTLADFLLVAGGLRATGGLDGPLWIVFFLVVVAETVLARAPELRLIHTGVAVAMILGTVPLPPARIDGSYLLEISTRLVFLVAVSSVNWRLRDTAARRNAELGELRSELQLAGERANLSREIHDGVGNALAASVLRLEVAARIAEKKGDESEETVALLREEAQALRGALNSVRDWTFFTRPWPSGGESGGDTGDALPSARIAEEIARLSRRTDLAMTVTGAEELDRLSPGARMAALRILQEALTNAAKYAEGANGAHVVIRPDGPNAVILTITDDGCGFDCAEPSGGNPPGVGLTSMRERAENVGGSLTITSATNCGVVVTARMPV